MSPFDINACKVVDENRDKQDQDIRRNEGHVENTTGRQQPMDPPPLCQKKEDSDHNGKEDSELERIK
jgi:hypothetical protein